MKKYTDIPGYELVKTETLSDVNSIGYLFRHKKSGARVAVVSNDDKNKVFYAGFRTPPKDSTGVAHIVEHTVLCGSKEFPAKDPFVELVKGSLNTFLNAMTYSDKTVYPVASENEKDFQNLMHVYLDAVFYPNIYKEKKIFAQEGWHYELESTESELTINGVVYNEMKGVYSSPEETLYRLIQQSLFPDTTYGMESGGDPEVIPELTYEDYLSFHQKYYHPSNSYIYLYGDMNVEEKLVFMDEQYLSQFEEITVDSEIGIQEAFTKVKELKEEYPVSEEEDGENQTFLSYNVQVGSCLDRKLYLAFQMLEYVLLASPAAPLKKALIEAGIGEDIMSSYDNGILQPVFSVIAKNAEEAQKDEFLTIIREKLQELVEEGIDKEALLGAVNRFEFRYREADFGRYPKGLIYGLSLLDSWLYDDEQVFVHMQEGEIFAWLRQQIGTNYYEELLKKYLLDNSYASVVTLSPQTGLNEKKENELKEQLKAYKESLTLEEQQAIVTATKELKAYQEEKDSKEVLDKIPMLERSDLERELPPFYNKEYDFEGKKLVFHEISTNGIAYLKILYPIDELTGYAPYLSLLATVLGYMDSEHYSFQELSNAIDIYTGGVITDVDYFIQKRKTNEFKTYFGIHAKFLYENMEKAMELLKEVCVGTLLSDTVRLKEIVMESKARLQMRLMSQGNLVAAGRATAYFSKSAALSEQLNGLEYYRFLGKLETEFEERKDSLVEILTGLVQTIFSKENAVISLTAEKEGLDLFRTYGKGAFLTKEERERENSWSAEYSPEIVCEKKNEGLKTSGQVQFVARAGNYMEQGFCYHGSMQVLKTILNYDYLWTNVRVKGGAYGCSVSISPDGNTFFASYRDPELAKTDEIYKNAWEFVEQFEADEEEMTKYIIGTMSNLDTSRTPQSKGNRSFHVYMTGITEEELKKNREETLNTTAGDIRELAKVIKAVTEAGYCCTVGNEKKVEECRELFLKTESLLA